jgi:hypothetical protein
MPENVNSPQFIADQPFCDLVIDTFDQMNNTTDLAALLTHYCQTCVGPDPVDAGY